MSATRVARPRLDCGVLMVDDQPRFMLAGEYPYYRDEPASWEPKLRAMRDVGLEVISFYVPWRHHEIEERDGTRSLRFAGDGNRDLAGFLDRVRRCGLLALPKPGPFVHAELQFGGLPDRLSPSVDSKRESARSAAGEPLRSQRLVLPAANCPAFVADVRAWLGAIGAFLRAWQYPDGPIVAVQVGNEGVYGEAGLPIDAHDYSAAGLAAFRAVAGCEPPHAWPDSPELADLRPLIAWGAWVADAMAGALRLFADCLNLDVPVLANLPPPPRAERHAGRPGGRYDAWLVRNRPERFVGIGYSFTNWVGNVVRDDEALVNYVLAARRQRGPNVEENWSLRWIDPECAFPAVPIYHALVSIACGATGVDVYTACSTDSWGQQLAVDREFLQASAGDSGLLDPPYGDAAPIGADGLPGRSFEALRVLAHFLAGAGGDIVAARPPVGVRWCVDWRHAAVRAWDPPSGTTIADRTLPLSASTLAAFAAHCLRRSVPFALADLYEETSRTSRMEEPLALSTGLFMHSAVQKYLASVLADGGALLLLGEVPELDERCEPCRILADGLRAAARRPGVVTGAPTCDADVAVLLDAWLADLPTLAAQPADRTRVELRLVNADTSATFVFLFNRLDEPRRLITDVGDVHISVQLPAFGCAAVQLCGPAFGGCFVKGISEQAGSAVPVVIEVGMEQIVSSHPCDLSGLRRRTGALEVHTSGGGTTNAITYRLRGAPP
jgi:beta-galactosidase